MEGDENIYETFYRGAQAMKVWAPLVEPNEGCTERRRREVALRLE